jgi:hypothetical protein
LPNRVVRALGAAALAGTLVFGGGAGLLTGGPAAALAASPGLTLVTAATYTVQPAAGRVALKVAITATNHLRDTATKRYYFRVAELAVLPGTGNF